MDTNNAAARTRTEGEASKNAIHLEEIVPALRILIEATQEIIDRWGTPDSYCS